VISKSNFKTPASSAVQKLPLVGSDDDELFTLLNPALRGLELGRDDARSAINPAAVTNGYFNSTFNGVETGVLRTSSPDLGATQSGKPLGAEAAGKGASKKTGSTTPTEPTSPTEPSGPTDTTSTSTIGSTTTTNGSTTTTSTADFSLGPPVGDATLPTDSYFGSQWYLTSSVAGINVAGAWANYTGKGIKVGIVDNGFDYNHKDLAANYRADLDYDARFRDYDAAAEYADENHGTAVASFAVGDRNGTGLVGVAYDADWAGFRIGYGSAGSSSQYADALVKARTMDVVNNSWGYSTPFQDNFKSWTAPANALRDAAALGRDGLGTNLVFAAMNNRAAGDNVNYHDFGNSQYVITVASVDSSGRVASTSDPGAALLVSAGGHYVLGADRTGSVGYNSGDYVTLSGTSFAAPQVSGVIALMLEANRDLGYRDVQEILALSARQIDVASAGWAMNAASNWNGGAMHFSHDYGFGIVDATAAVRLAESWQSQSTYANLVTQSLSKTGGALADGGTTSSQLSFTSAITVDKILVDLNLTHYKISDLVVTLTSPSGTTATLMNKAPTSLTSLSFEMSANNFWGESLSGTWTLKINDTVYGNSGTLNSWKMTALGDAATADSTYFYTNEFATFGAGSRAILSDASGIDTINAAAVTSNTILDLSGATTSFIAGKAVQIAAGSTIERAWLGDGSDTIWGNSSSNLIQAGRGDDVIHGSTGADQLWGSLGRDFFVYHALGEAGDKLMDFTVGEDVLDLRSLVASLGYGGADPLADHLISFADTGDSTTLMIDPDGVGAQQAAAFLTMNNVLSSSLEQGRDYWAVVLA
jgi:subtilisin-like proprotein convertase family protein